MAESKASRARAEAARRAAKRLPDPDSSEAYGERYAENFEVTGRGSSRRLHRPCPYCAAADFQVVDADGLKVTSPVLTCSNCGRSAQLVREELPDGGERVEWVHSGGNPPPGWMT